MYDASRIIRVRTFTVHTIKYSTPIIHLCMTRAHPDENTNVLLSL